MNTTFDWEAALTEASRLFPRDAGRRARARTSDGAMNRNRAMCADPDRRQDAILLRAEGFSGTSAELRARVLGSEHNGNGSAGRPVTQKGRAVIPYGIRIDRLRAEGTSPIILADLSEKLSALDAAADQPVSVRRTLRARLSTALKRVEAARPPRSAGRTQQRPRRSEPPDWPLPKVNRFWWSASKGIGLGSLPPSIGDPPAPVEMPTPEHCEAHRLALGR